MILLKNSNYLIQNYRINLHQEQQEPTFFIQKLNQLRKFKHSFKEQKISKEKKKMKIL
jgi:hypothetical protein